MSRAAYVVSYDISDPKRLRRVYKAMVGFGEHLQLSVFRCELVEADLVRMIARLDPLIHHTEDQVLIIHLGPAQGRSQRAFRALGKPYTPMPRQPVIV